MKIGITLFATDRSMSPVELAQEAEARGFYSLYIPEHTHIPTSRRTPPRAASSANPLDRARVGVADGLSALQARLVEPDSPGAA